MLLSHILGLGLLAVAASASYFILRYPYRGLKKLLSVADLGKLEGGLTALVRVIVIADHIEDPQQELRQAVKKNFARQVPYLFLISKSQADKELRGYYRLFETLAEIVSSKSLVKIQALPYDWAERPYVFYEIRDTQTQGGTRFLAVRGNQRREGIAEFYKLVEPEYALMIARGVLNDAPQPIEVREEQFELSNVVPPIESTILRVN